MISSNSSIDWTKLMSEIDKTEIIATPEFREWINGLLSEQTIKVTFNKKDGTIRTMKCTRNLQSIPNEYHPKNESAEKSISSVAVFDLDANGWRSFIPANITHIEYQ